MAFGNDMYIYHLVAHYEDAYRAFLSVRDLKEAFYSVCQYCSNVVP